MLSEVTEVVHPEVTSYSWSSEWELELRTVEWFHVWVLCSSLITCTLPAVCYCTRTLTCLGHAQAYSPHIPQQWTCSRVVSGMFAPLITYVAAVHNCEVLFIPYVHIRIYTTTPYCRCFLESGHIRLESSTMNRDEGTPTSLQPHPQPPELAPHPILVAVTAVIPLLSFFIFSYIPTLYLRTPPLIVIPPWHNIRIQYLLIRTPCPQGHWAGARHLMWFGGHPRGWKLSTLCGHSQFDASCAGLLDQIQI